MSTPANTTKNKLLHEASRMLLATGLNGFSLQQLAEKLNIKKSSLFHHYPSKTALAIELFRFYQQSFQEWTQQNQLLTSEKQIIAYGEKITIWICDKQRVCPVGALSLEWHQVEPELQKEIEKLHLLQKQWLIRLYKDINHKSGLRVPINEAVLSTMSMIQGSIQLARITEDSGMVTKNLKTYLKCIKDKR